MNVTMPNSLRRLTGTMVLATLLTAGCTSDGTYFGPDADATPPRPPDAGLDWGRPPDFTLGPPVTLTVATFNVRNFFDEVDDPSKADTVLSASEVAAKMGELGRALRLLKADVLALQEVENKQLLERLNQQELAGLGYSHLRLVEGNDMRGIDVALLSRYAIPRSVSHMQDRFQGVDGDSRTYGFSRDCLEATIEPSPGRKLVLLINHLRANDWKDPQEAIARRQAQAKRVREIADETLRHKPDANLAVLGDLNDLPGSKTLQLIQQGEPALVDALLELPAAKRYTTYYQGQQQQIDHLLLSPGLDADRVAGSTRVDHAEVFKVTSDHYPIIARFTLE